MFQEIAPGIQKAQIPVLLKNDSLITLSITTPENIVKQETFSISVHEKTLRTTPIPHHDIPSIVKEKKLTDDISDPAIIRLLILLALFLLIISELFRPPSLNG